MTDRVEKLKSRLPESLVQTLPKDFFENITAVISNDVQAELVVDTVKQYMHLLNEGNYTYTDYLNAVMFVTVKRSGCSQKEAYRRVFPDRYSRLLGDGQGQNISAYASAYAHNKLVVSLEKCFQYPDYVMNYPARGKVLQQMFDLTFNSKMDKDKIAAGKVFLDATKAPDEFDNVTAAIVQNTSVVDALKEHMSQLVSQQEKLINQGMPVKQLLEQKIIHKIEDDEDE